MNRRNAGGLVLAALAALLLSVLPTLIAQSQDKAEAALKAAMDKEVVDGNLKAAIEQYKKLAQGANKPVAARALVRLGQCYEKQGSADARKTYEQVLSRFGDQKEAVEQARTRLAALGGGGQAGQQAARLVWTGPKVYPDGSTVSADGRYISFTDWANGNLALHDLHSGADRHLTDNANFKRETHAFADYTAISRDGKQVAYGWDDAKNDAKDQGYDLRLVNVSGDPTPRRLYTNPDGGVVIPFDWSPDGKWIAVKLANKHTAQIALIAAQDGSLRVLKSMEPPGTSIGVGKILFSPDGKYLAYDRVADGGSQQRDVFVLDIDGSRETPVAAGPTREEVVGWSPDGKYLLFTSDRTGAIGLWALPLANGVPQGRPALVKPNLGQIVPMGWSAAGALYYGVRRPAVLARIQVASFDFDTGKFLSAPVDVAPEGVLESNTSPDWSPDGKSLAYLSRGATELGSYSIKIRSTETGQIRELRPKLYGPSGLRWAPDGRSFASPQQNGDILRVDAETGETSLLVHRLGVRGVVPWSPDGKKIYYSRVESDSPTFVERDLASGNDRELIRRPVLGGVNLSPDGTHIATASAEPSTKLKTILLIPVAGGEPLEVMKAGNTSESGGVLAWARDSRSVLIQKTYADGKRAREVWRVSLDGSQPRKLYDLDPRVGWGTVHPDGRQIAFAPAQESAGQTRSAEVWVLENFLPGTKGATAAK